MTQYNVHIDRELIYLASRIHLFTCKNCGYKSNDDRIAAMNLHQIGINYLIDNKVPVIVE